MKPIGTEIRLFTDLPNRPNIKVKFLEDEKGDIKKAYVSVSNEHLFDVDTLSLAWELDVHIVQEIGKKIKKSSQIYKYIQEKISTSFVNNFQITHLKIHPLLQVRNSGAGFVRFDDEVKEEFWLKPKKRFEELLKQENKKTKGETKE